VRRKPIKHPYNNKDESKDMLHDGIFKKPKSEKGRLNWPGGRNCGTEGGRGEQIKEKIEWRELEFGIISQGETADVLGKKRHQRHSFHAPHESLKNSMNEPAGGQPGSQ